jgi:predicted nucleotidyltransferase
MKAETDERLKRATRILREEGAREVYLFGSVAEGREGPNSDLDLGVSGLPAERFYRAVGRLLSELLIPVDLVDLDRPTPLVRRLRQTGKLRRVG